MYIFTIFGLVLPPFCFRFANLNFGLSPKLGHQISPWTQRKTNTKTEVTQYCLYNKLNIQKFYEKKSIKMVRKNTVQSNKDRDTIITIPAVESVFVRSTSLTNLHSYSKHQINMD